ncbi:hypothetical protein SRHO_G00166900 [Serrasalmus rhombeus]
MLQRSTTLPLVSLHRKSHPVWTQVCGETSSLADEGQEWSLAAVQPQTAAPSHLPCIEARLRMTRSWPRGADVNWVMAEKIRFSIWAVPLTAEQPPYHRLVMQQRQCHSALGLQPLQSGQMDNQFPCGCASTAGQSSPHLTVSHMARFLWAGLQIATQNSRASPQDPSKVIQPECLSISVQM